MTTIKFKQQRRTTRVEAAARLNELATALRDNAKFELERGEEKLALEFDVPEEVMLELEVEFEEGKTELEVEIKWASVAAVAASTQPET